MPASIISFEYEKLLRSYESIGEAIVDYINNMGLVWEIEMARRVYFGDIIKKYGAGDYGINYKPFIQWLIFSFKLHAGRPLIDCVFNDNHAHNLAGYEKDMLHSLRNSYESLYKVCDIEAERVLLKDVFLRQSLYVWDNVLSRNIKNYQGVLMRIVAINGKNLPIPGYSIMTNCLLKNMEQYIIHRYNQHKSFNNGLSLKNFLNLNSLMLHRYFLNHSYDNAKPY